MEFTAWKFVKTVNGKKLLSMTIFLVIKEHHVSQMLTVTNSGFYCLKKLGQSCTGAMNGLRLDLPRMFYMTWQAHQLRLSNVMNQIFGRNYVKPTKKTGLWLLPQALLKLQNNHLRNSDWLVITLTVWLELLRLRINSMIRRSLFNLEILGVILSGKEIGAMILTLGQQSLRNKLVGLIWTMVHSLWVLMISANTSAESKFAELKTNIHIRHLKHVTNTAVSHFLDS